MSNNVLLLIAMIIGPFLVVLVSLLAGQHIGASTGKKSPGLKDAPFSSVVTAAFGLFAFMLAFTFQIASGRFDKRKDLLVEEVTNIRTTFLRAGLLPEPFRSSIKKQLVEYVNLRVALMSDQSKLNASVQKSQVILDSCWKYAEQLAEMDRSSEVYALYTSSANDLVSNFNQRITMAVEFRLQPTILWVLLIICVFSMFLLGYQFGASGNSSLGVNVALSVIFAVVIFLIFALDHAESGLVKVNQKPMLTLQEQLQKTIQK